MNGAARIAVRHTIHVAKEKMVHLEPRQRLQWCRIFWWRRGLPLREGSSDRLPLVHPPSGKVTEWRICALRSAQLTVSTVATEKRRDP